MSIIITKSIQFHLIQNRATMHTHYPNINEQLNGDENMSLYKDI